MNVFKGTVQTKRDGSKKGWLTVKPDGWGFEGIGPNQELKGISADGTLQVKYVSPYGGGMYAGFVAMPEAESQVIFCLTDNGGDDVYYYLGCIIHPEFDVPVTNSSFRTGAGVPNNPHDYDDYDLNAQSMSYGIRSPLGQRILLQEFRGGTSGAPIENKRVKIESQRHHGLYLDDNTKTQKALLKSAKQGAVVELIDMEGNWDPSRGPDSAHIYAKQSMYLKAWQGGMKLQVADGKNLQILNNSTGGNAGVSGNTENKELGACEKQEAFGNILIHTDKGDVVISSTGNGVFIDCMGGMPEAPDGTIPTGASFQVRSLNKIHLYSQNGIDLKSDGPVNIKGSTVSIEGSTIDLNPTGSIDGDFGIRKTNWDMLQELATAAAAPFFAGGFGDNYTEGRNNDSRL